MEIDIDGPTPEVTPAGDAQRTGVLSLARDIVLHPTAAMRRLAANPGRLWLVPIIALAVLSAAVVVVTLPARERHDTAATIAQYQQMAERNPQMFGNQDPDDVVKMATAGPTRAIGRITGLAAALIGPFLIALVTAAVLHFLGTLLGGQQNYTQMLTVNAWSRIPLVLQSALRLVVWGVAGTYDPSPNGLAGLVAADASQAFTKPSPWGPVLAQISVWNLWTLALLFVAVRVVCHVSARKALVVMAIYVGLILVLGEAGVGFGRVVSGLAEGFAGG